MYLGRDFKQNLTAISALLLCLVLLSVQGAKLHVHYLDCGHEPSTGPMATHESGRHPTHTKVHLVTDNSHHAHPKAGMSELDLSPQGLLKNLPGIGNLILAVICICLLLLPVFIRLKQRQRYTPPPHSWRYALSPPLRAPPRV